MSLHRSQCHIETARLLLRPLAVTDAPGMFEVYSDEQTMTYWSDPPISTVGEAAKMIRADLDLVSKDAAAFWAVTLRETGEVIGKVTLMHYSAQNQRAEIGYILNRRHWRKGLMCEALTAVLGFAFGALDLNRIEADTDVDNTASLALLEKLGFRREGLFRERWRVYSEWKDSVMLGLLKSDWQTREQAG